MQIGDPFAEKLLIEASLELIDEDLLEGLQDLGGAGLTCAVERVRGASRDRRAAGPRRRAAPRAGDGGVRDPHVASRRSGCSRSCIPRSSTEVRAVCAQWGLATAVVADAGAGWGPGRPASQASRSRRSPRGRSPTKAPVYERPMRSIDRANGDDPTFAPFDGDLGDALRSLLAAPNVASQAMGLRAVRPHGPGPDGRGPGLGCGGRSRAGDDEGARAVGRRQRAVRLARPLPRRGARRRRGRPERRGDRREAARDHELPELRQPRAPRGDVAVLRGDPRDARRVPRARDPGHRRERELLQRVRRLGDLAHAGGRDAGTRSPITVSACPPGSRRRASPSTSWGRSFAELGGSEFAETVLGVVAGTTSGARPRGRATAPGPGAGGCGRRSPRFGARLLGRWSGRRARGVRDRSADTDSPSRWKETCLRTSFCSASRRRGPCSR